MLESEDSVISIMLIARELSLYLRQRYDNDNSVLSLPKLIPFLLQGYHIHFEHLMGRSPTTTEWRFMLGPLIELDQAALYFITSTNQCQKLEDILFSH